MLAVAFDTLKLARKLESAGFPARQAQDASAALAESITEWHAVGNLATREDVQTIQAALKDDLQKTRTELRSDIQKLDARISDTNTEIAKAKAEILKWMFGSIAVQTIALLAALVGLVHGGRL